MLSLGSYAPSIRTMIREWFAEKQSELRWQIKWSWKSGVPNDSYSRMLYSQGVKESTT